MMQQLSSPSLESLELEESLRSWASSAKLLYLEIQKKIFMYVPIIRLKVAILKSPLLHATSANCYYGDSSLQKWQAEVAGL
jgi:hypothetical protein